MHDALSAPMQRSLRDIERDVLHAMWIGRVRGAVTGALVITVVATSVLWWLDFSARSTTHLPNRVPTIALGAAGVAALSSVAGLFARRFRWCCAAAYCCGLASVVGIGAFWWLQTGRTGAPLGWLVGANVAMVALTVAWLTLIMTPLERCQPDMRALGGNRH